MENNPWKFRQYRVREAAQEGFSDEGEEDKTRFDFLSGALKVQSKSERTRNFFKLLKSFVPEKFRPSQNTLNEFFYDSSQLPFDTENYDFSETSIARGAQAKLYLLESKDVTKKSIALKVYKPLREKVDVEEHAKILRGEVEKAKTIYSSMPELVPDEHYLIMEDPFMKGSKAVALIEEFYGKDIQDFFAYDTEKLKKEVSQDPELKKFILQFIEITLKHLDETGELVDIIGDKNLVLAKTDKGRSMRLLDPHNFHSLHTDDPIMKASLERRVESLKEFKKHFSSVSKQDKKAA